MLVLSPSVWLFYGSCRGDLLTVQASGLAGTRCCTLLVRGLLGAYGRRVMWLLTGLPVCAYEGVGGLDRRYHGDAFVAWERLSECWGLCGGSAKLMRSIGVLVDGKPELGGPTGELMRV